MIAVSLINLDKKDQHTHAHNLLRECLRPMGIHYDDSTPIIKGEYGKPALAEHPDIHFNLSHADGICACIVSHRECGIDCESIRDFRPNILKRIFSEQEQAYFQNVPDVEKNTAFFRLWTLKESYIKAIGRGLSFPMNRAEFLPDENGFTVNIREYAFRQYIIRGEFVVSVCEKIE